jgi:TPR repeat protein
MYFRAFCLENGFGVTLDMEAATEWYRKAAAAGHPKAQKWCKDRRLPF